MVTMIITHNNDFHCDDVMSVAMLKTLIRDEVKIIRTRDQAMMSPEKDKFIIDVGGVYDPSNRQYDHHQKLSIQREDPKSEYSSLGLLWKDFGRSYIFNLLPEIPHDVNNISTTTFINCVWKQVDKNFVAGIDAYDTGCETEPKGLIPLNISCIVKQFNVDGEAGFNEAVNIAQVILKTYVKSTIATSVEEMIIRDDIINPDNTINDTIFLGHKGPWKRIVQSNPEVWNHTLNIKYVWFKLPEEDMWGMSALPATPITRTQTRITFTEGLRSICPALQFIHKTGFYATFKATSFDEAKDAAKSISDALTVQPVSPIDTKQ